MFSNVFFNCVYVWECVCTLSVGAHGDQKPWMFLELELHGGGCELSETDARN